MSGYTVEQLRALEKAYAEGVHKVKYQDKEIEYRSMAHMKSIIEEMRRELGETPKKASTRSVGIFQSGL